MDIREDNLPWSQILGELDHYLFSKSKHQLQNTCILWLHLSSVQMYVLCLMFMRNVNIQYQYHSRRQLGFWQKMQGMGMEADKGNLLAWEYFVATSNCLSKQS